MTSFLSYIVMLESYWVIGVSRNAQADEIRRGYRQLAKLGVSLSSPEESERFGRTVQRAYEVGSVDSSETQLGLKRFVHPSLMQWTLHKSLIADEIDIDFPSVVAIADRARCVFVDQDRNLMPLQADAQITSKQAHHGTTIQLDVPVQCTCVLCGGRGEIWGELCAVCYGSGSKSCSSEVRLMVPPGISSGAIFRFEITPDYAATTAVEVQIAVNSID